MRARARVLAEHTAAHRAQTLERYLVELSPATRHEPAPRAVVMGGQATSAR
jgi:hypothetical protein